MAAKQSKDDFNLHRTLPSRSRDGHRLAGSNTPLEDIAGITTREKRRGFNLKRALASFLLICLAFFLLISVWDMVELSRASKKMFGSGNLFSLLLGNNLSSHDGRTNLLLAGYSADDPGHQGADLTDSIMLISLDSRTKTGYMLSIPRDLYVNIPGDGYAKINEVYQDGNQMGFAESGYPAGGMGLLEKIVANDFGVPIDYYALVNYAAFRDTVNAVGGITINIQSSDPRGIYDPSTDYTSKTCCALAKYPNGPASLNGKQALNLARARGDAYGSYGLYSDFDRTNYQRKMLVALRQKAVSWKTVLNPTKSGHLFDGMANNVKTDVDVSSVLPLYSLLNKVNTSSLKSYSLRDLNGKNYLSSYESYYAGDSLIPSAGVDDYSQIQQAVSGLNQP
jgi:polyisoprenyl-teichoic acid--peptidoglycan teichoic acid transferase